MSKDFKNWTDQKSPAGEMLCKVCYKKIPSSDRKKFEKKESEEKKAKEKKGRGL